MNFSNEGYDGLRFYDFHVRRDSSTGPGWFIFGRNKSKYGVDANGNGRYVMLCGYVRQGSARNYNGKVRIGWATKKAAEAALAAHLVNYPFLNLAA
jgi:hypothetical protein